MEEFVKFCKNDNVFQDLKDIFPFSAKFDQEDLSEEQKIEYLELNYQSIFRKFYRDLHKADFWEGASEQKISTLLKSNQVEKSKVVDEFDTWLDKEDN